MSGTTIFHLPHEVLVEIFQYLPLEDLIKNVQYVSKLWNFVAQDSLLWREYFFKPPIGMKSGKVCSLLKKAPFLEAFEFRENLDVDKVIAVLTDNNNNLRHLAMGNNMLCSKHIEKLLEHVPALESLQIFKVDFLGYLLLSHFPYLKKIKYAQMGWDSNMDRDDHETIIQKGSWSMIEEIELTTNHVSHLLIQLIGKRACKLLTLVMNCPGNSDIAYYLKECTSLRKLSLNFFSMQVTSMNMDDFFKGLKNLKNLRYLCLTSFVDSNPNVLNNMFFHADFPYLTELDLSHFMNITPTVMQSVIEACPELKIIRLKGCVTVDDNVLKTLSKCSLLRYLDISGCIRITDIGLSYLFYNTCLREINLSWIGLVTHPMLQKIASIQSLQILNLDHNEIDFNKLHETLLMMPNLRLISVVGTGIDGNNLQRSVQCRVKHCERSINSIVRERANHTKCLCMNGVSNTVLSCLPHYGNLEELNINFLMRPCSRFDEIANHIKRVSLQSLSLKSLVLENENTFCAIFQEGSLKNLVELKLQHCVGLGLSSAQCIAECCPHLQRLSLNYCLSINDKSLLVLSKLQELHYLDLSSCHGIAKAKLVHLKKFTHLKELNLAGLGKAGNDPRIMTAILSVPTLQTIYMDETISNYLRFTSRRWICEKSQFPNVARFRRPVC